MIKTRGYAVQSAESKFESYEFERRELKNTDVLIEILYCGVCHSDIHQARGDWGNSTFPMVPGHEIVGRVARVGSDVSKFKEGDFAGVGCFVDSCGECANCVSDVEQFCLVHCSQTYNGTEMDKTTPTYGGYSSQIVVDEHYALKINVGAGQKVGIVGLGGLGHMGVKFAVSMGAEVTVFSTSPSKEADARALGAHNFVVTKDPENMKPLAGQFDFILDCVSAAHDLNMYLGLLKYKGAMVLVGAPEKPAELYAFPLIINNRTLAGSGIGGIAETQEMLDYCAKNNITSDIEIIQIQDIETAYERTIKSDVRYRFVIDMQSL